MNATDTEEGSAPVRTLAEHEEDVQQCEFNPVVAVPLPEGTLFRPVVVEAPLDAATHWDARLWRNR